MLAEEFGTASNIKSRVNRQSVLSAITSTQQRLKLYNKVGACAISCVLQSCFYEHCISNHITAMHHRFILCVLDCFREEEGGLFVLVKAALQQTQEKTFLNRSDEWTPLSAV